MAGRRGAHCKKSAQARAQVCDDYGKFSSGFKIPSAKRSGDEYRRIASSGGHGGSAGSGDGSSSSNDDYIWASTEWVRIQSLGGHGGPSSSRARGPSSSRASKRQRTAVVTPPTKVSRKVAVKKAVNRNIGGRAKKKEKFAAMTMTQKVDSLMEKVDTLLEMSASQAKEQHALRRQVIAMLAKVYQK